MVIFVVLWPVALAAALVVRLAWFVLTLPFRVILHHTGRKRRATPARHSKSHRVKSRPAPPVQSRPASPRPSISPNAPIWGQWQPSPPPHCPPPGHPAWMVPRPAPWGPNEAPRGHIQPDESNEPSA